MKLSDLGEFKDDFLLELKNYCGTIFSLCTIILNFSQECLNPCIEVFALNNSTVSCVVQISVKMHLHVVFFIGFGFGFKEWSDLLRKKCFSDCEKHLEIQG